MIRRRTVTIHRRGQLSGLKFDMRMDWHRFRFSKIRVDRNWTKRAGIKAAEGGQRSQGTESGNGNGEGVINFDGLPLATQKGRLFTVRIIARN